MLVEAAEIAPVDEVEGQRDQEGAGRGDVADRDEVVVRGGAVTAGLPQLGRPTVRGLPAVRVAPAQLALQQLADQPVEAQRIAALVDPGEEEAAAAEALRDAARGRAEQAGDELAVEPREHRQRQRSFALVVGQAVEDLGDEVVGEQAVGAGQGRGHAVGLGLLGQREEHEVETDRPALGPLVQRHRGAVVEAQPAEGAGRLHRLVVGEPQVLGPDLGQPAA